MTHLRLILPASISSLLALACGLHAGAVMSSQNVIEVVRKSKALGEGARISAAVAGEDVSLSSFRNKADTQKDLKIEAVMAAKALIDVDAGIRRVTVRFYEVWQPRRYAEITVTAAQIKAFGSGTLTSEDLLASLRFVEGTHQQAKAAPAGSEVPVDGMPVDSAAEQDAQVAEGPQKSERVALLRRIKALYKQGVGTKPFLDAFAQVETLAAANQVALLERSLDSLTHSVVAQEVRIEAISKRPPAGAAANGATATVSAPPASMTPNSVVATNDLLNMTRGRYGWFAPSTEGLLAADRFAVAERLYALKVKGVPVEKYAGLFKEMEASAAAGQLARTELALRNFWYYIKPNPPILPR